MDSEPKKSIKSFADYPETYIEACFFAWYHADRPKLRSLNSTSLMKIIPTAPDGRRPSLATVRAWQDKYGWELRADAMDAELARQLEVEAIEKKAQKYREIAQMGNDLMKEGYDYITEKGFDTSASAVRAVGLGSEMIAKFGSAADRMLLLGSMTPKQLDALAHKLLGKSESEDDITVEAEDVEDVEDGEEEIEAQDDDNGG